MYDGGVDLTEVRGPQGLDPASLGIGAGIGVVMIAVLSLTAFLIMRCHRAVRPKGPTRQPGGMPRYAAHHEQRRPTSSCRLSQPSRPSQQPSRPSHFTPSSAMGYSDETPLSSSHVPPLAAGFSDLAAHQAAHFTSTSGDSLHPSARISRRDSRQQPGAAGGGGEGGGEAEYACNYMSPPPRL